MAELSERARAMQQELQQRYNDSLPHKQADLATAWQSVQTENFSTESLARLKELAHRLAGSAGSYGLEEMGLAALALEQAILKPDMVGLERNGVEYCMKELLRLLEDAQKKPDLSGKREVR